MTEERAQQWSRRFDALELAIARHAAALRFDLASKAWRIGKLAYSRWAVEVDYAG